MTPDAEEVAPIRVDLDGWRVQVEGALGARALPYVGPESDVVTYDPFGTEGVAVFPAAVGARIERGVWFGELRVEEGTVHAGGLEAAAARVGAESSAGFGQAWIGRDDVRFTADRAIEPEDLAFSVRPALSRAWLPLHATGGGGTLGWPGRAALQVEIAYPSITADAPYTIARADVFPLGPVPSRASTPTAGIRFDVGAAVARLGSEALGVQTGWTVDAAVQWGPVGVRAGWTAVNAAAPMSELLVEGDVRLLPNAPASPAIGLRGEHATGLVEGEDERWIVTGRGSVDLLQRRVCVWAEGYHSLERGSSVSSGEDVVVLDGSIERANDAVVLGLLLHS